MCPGNQGLLIVEAERVTGVPLDAVRTWGGEQASVSSRAEIPISKIAVLRCSPELQREEGGPGAVVRSLRSSSAQSEQNRLMPRCVSVSKLQPRAPNPSCRVPGAGLGARREPGERGPAPGAAVHGPG